MEFELFDGNNLVTIIEADTENLAWQQLDNIGLKNRSNIYTLIPNVQY